VQPCRARERRTPVLQAGITKRPLTFREILCSIPPPIARPSAENWSPTPVMDDR